MADIQERLDQMELRIREPKFRQTTGRANEANYWVFDYAPQDELMVRERIAYLQHKNHNGMDDFELIVYDLYDLMIAHLQQKNFMEKCYAKEEKRGIANMRDAILHSLRITEEDNLIVQYIVEHTPDNAVVLLTGVGKCFPILQAQEVFNNILYNMPQSFSHVPMVLFYPGTYTEQDLVIFNEYSQVNYYRAFRLVR